MFAFLESLDTPRIFLWQCSDVVESVPFCSLQDVLGMAAMEAMSFELCLMSEGRLNREILEIFDNRPIYNSKSVNTTSR
jgi:hypothetical protein